ncbi:MAG: sn-glycerol-3-phosphate ABC transporter ATP-binding protein UgpC [Myxococcales bacterium]|nr:sn-glycerol-3-phosphate ABC transporter ATP-binding protein UgpC [Myxococcales bacterium]
MVAVSVQQVTKSFGATKVLRGVDVHVPAGGFAVLVGPSGCGKSTLLRLLAGLEEVTSGSIRFGEREVTRLEPRERDIAMVFQSYALYPHLTVRDNLAFGLRLRKTDPAEIGRRVDEAAAMLGLSHLLDRLPKALSGGQRQRVAMGRAIVRRPALFLFDEPLSNLDAALRAQVRVDIRKLHDQLGATSVYVTHDQVEAMTLADVMFVLNGGVVEQQGAPLEVYDAPATRFVAGFLGSPAMNFIKATIEDAGGGGLRARLGDGSANLALPPGLPARPGQAVEVGVRPHDLELCDESAAEIHLKVDFVELLGPEIHAHCVLAGAPVIACLETRTGVSVGDTLPLRVRRLHLFDQESGRALR